LAIQPEKVGFHRFLKRFRRLEGGGYGFFGSDLAP
jgi:hypothetical protein